MAQAGTTRAPWPITTIVSCLPVLVLAMGTALAHMLGAAAEAIDTPDNWTGPLAVLRSVSPLSQDQDGPDRRGPEAGQDRSARQDQRGPQPEPQYGRGIAIPGLRPAGPQVEQAHLIARRLATAGKPVSRRALRSGGLTGSNEALNAPARMINTELAEGAGSG
jgi:hypothetical protein